jgi:AhpD family alkylhydroperoxidase
MTAMKARLDPRKASPEAMKAMANLHAYVGKCGLDHKLLELAKLRASQINGCAWCMDMHTKELRAAGESEQRLYLLSAWRECPFSVAHVRCPHARASEAGRRDADRPARPARAAWVVQRLLAARW